MSSDLFFPLLGFVCGTLIAAVGFAVRERRRSHVLAREVGRLGAEAELLERRDAAYAALRDLEQDHRTGKVNGEDYAAERAHLRQEAASVLRMLDQLDSMDVKADQEA